MFSGCIILNAGWDELYDYQKVTTCGKLCCDIDYDII